MAIRKLARCQQKCDVARSPSLIRLCRNDHLHHFLAKLPVPTHRGCFKYAILGHFISIMTQSVMLRSVNEREGVGSFGEELNGLGFLSGDSILGQDLINGTEPSKLVKGNWLSISFLK